MIIFNNTEEYITTANFIFINQEYLGQDNILIYLFRFAKTTQVIQKLQEEILSIKLNDQNAARN
jgi:hypothetical protein